MLARGGEPGRRGKGTRGRGEEGKRGRGEEGKRGRGEEGKRGLLPYHVLLFSFSPFLLFF
jgi:hypothetical protein